MSEYGLRCRNPNNGAIILEITDRLSREVGSVYTGTSPGSFTVPMSIPGDVYFYVSSGTNIWLMPEVVLSGRTISWSWAGASGSAVPSRAAATIVYGVY